MGCIKGHQTDVQPVPLPLSHTRTKATTRPVGGQSMQGCQAKVRGSHLACPLGAHCLLHRGASQSGAAGLPQGSPLTSHGPPASWPAGPSALQTPGAAPLPAGPRGRAAPLAACAVAPPGPSPGYCLQGCWRWRRDCLRRCGPGARARTPHPHPQTSHHCLASCVAETKGVRTKTKHTRTQRQKSGGWRREGKTPRLPPIPPNTARPDEDKVSSPSLARRRERARARVREGRDYKVVPK